MNESANQPNQPNQINPEESSNQGHDPENPEQNAGEICFTKIRCQECGKLLLEISSENAVVRVVCSWRKCKTMNYAEIAGNRKIMQSEPYYFPPAKAPPVY